MTKRAERAAHLATSDNKYKVAITATCVNCLKFSQSVGLSAVKDFFRTVYYKGCRATRVRLSRGISKLIGEWS